MSLQVFAKNVPNTFMIPAKLINEGSDLSTFLVSQGYHDILSYLALLNHSMFPANRPAGPITFELPESKPESDADYIPAVAGLQRILEFCERTIDEAPPDPGPRRFGNVSFRKWYRLVEENASEWLEKHLPAGVTKFEHIGEVTPTEELRAYFLGGFGSAQRLDYGTGHELSFMAFLAGIWKLGGFAESHDEDALREIVRGVVQPYLVLIRRLILTYNLEPAGTHGVWGLDDHSFVPYIFGSAQYGPTIDASSPTPTEGSLPDAPDPGDIVKKEKVESLRASNFYFGAIGFIYDVKKGPFWEHSPTLYDISGVKAGWGKINKGMMKMYNAEVLSKFPVVQHFPFGSLFKWDRSADARDYVPDIHSQSQPQQRPPVPSESRVPGPIDVTSTMQGAQAGLTRAPWAQGAGRLASVQRMPAAKLSNIPATQAPWASRAGQPARSNESKAITSELPSMTEDTRNELNLPTKAPWAK